MLSPARIAISGKPSAERQRVSINSGPRRRVTRIRNSGWESQPKTSLRDKTHCVRRDARTQLLPGHRPDGSGGGCGGGSGRPLRPLRLPPLGQEPSLAGPGRVGRRGGQSRPFLPPGGGRARAGPRARTAGRRGPGSPRRPEREKPQVSAPSWGFPVAALLRRGARGARSGAAPVPRPKLSEPAYLGAGVLPPPSPQRSRPPSGRTHHAIIIRRHSRPPFLPSSLPPSHPPALPPPPPRAPHSTFPPPPRRARNRRPPALLPGLTLLLRALLRAVSRARPRALLASLAHKERERRARPCSSLSAREQRGWGAAGATGPREAPPAPGYTTP